MTDIAINGKSPRDLTREERRSLFLAFKNGIIAKAEPNESRFLWHEIDDEMTPKQYEQIPPGRPGVDGRTKPVWVKFHHRELRQLVIAKGFFDHEDGKWLARYYQAGDGDLICQVEPTAWAKILPDVVPDDAPVIESPPGGGV